MKKLNAIFLIRIFALLLTLNLVSILFPEKISAQQDDTNFQVFYDQLSPYGQWIEDYNYGYIWIPMTDSDFTPYLSNGYWIFTEYGWMWTSDYDWGWATFHYGRWDYNGSYGWFWVPDNEWGPSWVTWRWSKGYYGWAPMRPGVSISITFGNYNDVPNDRWVFVRDRDIERHDISKNHIGREQNFNIMNNSTVINKTYYDNKRRSTYVAGPDRQDVQKITGRTIKPVTIHERDKPGQSMNNDQLQIYRPRIRNSSQGAKPAPPELSKYKDVKQISERNTEKNKQNTEPMQSKTDKKNQRAVNPINDINSKSRGYQQQRLDPLKKGNIKEQSQQLRKTNPPIENKSKNKSDPKRYSDPPKNQNKIDVPPPPKKINIPNNNLDKRPKERAVNPVKKISEDQRSKSNHADKKDTRKLQ